MIRFFNQHAKAFCALALIVGACSETRSSRSKSSHPTEEDEGIPGYFRETRVESSEGATVEFENGQIVVDVGTSDAPLLIRVRRYRVQAESSDAVTLNGAIGDVLGVEVVRADTNELAAIEDLKKAIKIQQRLTTEIDSSKFEAGVISSPNSDTPVNYRIPNNELSIQSGTELNLAANIWFVTAGVRLPDFLFFVTSDEVLEGQDPYIDCLNPKNLSLLPTTVIGQKDATTNYGMLRGMSYPIGVTTCNGKMFIADRGNHRVLGYNTIPTSNHASPDFVLGQAHFYTRETETISSSYMNTPYAVHCDGTRLFVSDALNHRVLIWNTVPSSTKGADVVVGKGNMMTNATTTTNDKELQSPYGVFSDGTRLVVSDQGHNRVMIWNNIPTSNGKAADVILGQANSSADYANRGSSALAANTMNAPFNAIIAGGKLIVADTGNARVLIWNTIPTVTGASADVVVGQASMTAKSSTNSASVTRKPIGLYSDGTTLYVADYLLSRIMKWSTIPTTNGVAADVIIGQPDATSGSVNAGNATASATTFNHPSLIAGDGQRIFVSDFDNNRVLVFNGNSLNAGAAASYVLGQPNLEQTTPRNSGVSASAINYPSAATTDGTHVAIADQLNHRVLIWNHLPKDDGEDADIVLGQPDFSTNTVNTGGISGRSMRSPTGATFYNGKLIVADSGNSRILVWNNIPTENHTPADYVIGQPSDTDGAANTGGASASTMSNARSAFVSGDKLIAADAENFRILIWNTFPTQTGTPADVVIGQADFTSVAKWRGQDHVTADSFYLPFGIEVIGGRLVVSDYRDSRILIWNKIPESNGVAPDLVLGQPDLTSNGGNNGGISEKTVFDPGHLRTFGSRLFLADFSNNRIMVWNTLPTENFTGADLIIGQASANTRVPNNGGLTAKSLFGPAMIYPFSGGYLTTDLGNARVLLHQCPK